MVPQVDSDFLLKKKKTDLNINISLQSKVMKKGIPNKKTQETIECSNFYI